MKLKLIHTAEEIKKFAERQVGFVIFDQVHEIKIYNYHNAQVREKKGHYTHPFSLMTLLYDKMRVCKEIIYLSPCLKDIIEPVIALENEGFQYLDIVEIIENSFMYNEELDFFIFKIKDIDFCQFLMDSERCKLDKCPYYNQQMVLLKIKERKEMEQ